MSASGTSKESILDKHRPPSLANGSLSYKAKKKKNPIYKTHHNYILPKPTEMERDPMSVEPSPNCPRCGSCNTKFCYYNNYSLTQPRYFCKGCRRYWTRGGSLRNVPIGGTCRRSRRIVKPRLTAFHIASNNHRNFGYGIGHHHLSNASSSLISMENKNNPNNVDLAQVYTSFLNQNHRTLHNSVHLGLHHPSGGFPRVESESFYTFHDGSFKFISKFDQIQEKDDDEEEGILQPFMGSDHLMMTNNNFGFMLPLPGGLEGLGWPRPTHVGSPTNLMVLENIENSKELFPRGVGQDTPQDRYI